MSATSPIFCPQPLELASRKFWTRGESFAGMERQDKGRASHLKSERRHCSEFQSSLSHEIRLHRLAARGTDIDARETLQPFEAPQFHNGLEEQDHGWCGASSRGSQNNRQTAKRSDDEESICDVERGYQQDYRAQKRIVNPRANIATVNSAAGPLHVAQNIQSMRSL
mmetsp:Transcript_375/g.877  ORF Transcript_375/g.877 Transcript_375/m.877 type:complete len:167 (+) Transcript_375:397-897(+)